MTIDEWRRRFGREPTQQDLRDARMLIGRSDGPKRASGVNPMIRPRLVKFDRAIVARKNIPGGRIPRRNGKARERERSFAAAFRRVATATAAADNPDNISEMSDQ